ncbi:hypothetical protein OIU77_023833 [Salix suchowensis]|uniref:Uncharacterized protein n=1 Tax=Salix suchowensis TaxID=1278906 RepID=A0ABQ9C8B6_9ROSI|nr:hypothetical protein OIU77_023833 [Salix suchowensis]
MKAEEEEGLKLFTNKPKKATASSSSSSTAAAASYKMGSQSTTPPQPPQPPKESFARRYKFLWPLLLTVNLAVGAFRLSNGLATVELRGLLLLLFVMH